MSEVIPVNGGEMDVMPSHPMEAGAAEPEPGIEKMVQFPGQDAPIGTEYTIKGFLVSALCSDGAMRQVTLTDKQAKKLTKFLLHAQGGQLQLQAGPLYMLVRQPKGADKGPVITGPTMGGNLVRPAPGLISRLLRR